MPPAGQLRSAPTRFGSPGTSAGRSRSGRPIQNGPAVLEVQNLSKQFGSVVAVADVSFRVERGESVGLLGPNGAGKTTTVSMICGLLRPDSGQVLFDGRPIQGDADPHKRQLGLVPQELALIEELTALANLRFFGAMQGMSGVALRDAIDQSLELVGLTGRSRDRVRTFSGGMKRRLNLAAALLHDPDLIVLDEPTVGIDPQSRNAIFEGLETLKGLGKSLLYTTHYMEEAERLCDRLVIVDHGKVVADGELGVLAKLVPSTDRLVLGIHAPATSERTWLESVRSTPGVVSAQQVEDRLILEISGLKVTPRILDRLNDSGVTVTQISGAPIDLQTIFLNLTGRGLRDQ